MFGTLGLYIHSNSHVSPLPPTPFEQRLNQAAANHGLGATGGSSGRLAAPEQTTAKIEGRHPEPSVAGLDSPLDHHPHGAG